MYLALTRMNVDGEMREPGDPVPEAAEWTNLSAYLGFRIGMASSDDEIRATKARVSGRPLSDVPLAEVKAAHDAEKAFWQRRETEKDRTVEPVVDTVDEPEEETVIERVEIDENAREIRETVTPGRGGRKPRH